MKTNLLKLNMRINKYILIIILLSISFSNSRVAFSRPGAIMRTPGTMSTTVNDRPLLFSVGFSREIVNIDLKSNSSSIYLQGTINDDYHLGISYTYLADPRTSDEISPRDETEPADYSLPTEIGVHLQKRVYQVGNINIDIGINDIF